MFDLKTLDKFTHSREKILNLIPVWESSYRHIDVRDQIKWAHNWLLENPTRDKKDYIRYLGNWMRNAERRAVERSTNVVRHPIYREDRPREEDIVDAETIAKAKGA